MKIKGWVKPEGNVLPGYHVDLDVEFTDAEKHSRTRRAAWVAKRRAEAARDREIGLMAYGLAESGASAPEVLAFLLRRSR